MRCRILLSGSVFRIASAIYVIQQQDAEAAAELQTDLRRRGWQLATVDALIAAVALRHNLVLLTTDGDYAAVAGLHLENWLPR